MTKSRPSKALPPAVPMFQAYLARRHIKQTPFCEKKGLDRIQVQKAVKGQRSRISLDFALDFHRATGGAVPYWAWSTKHKGPPQRRASRKPPAPAPKAAA